MQIKEEHEGVKDYHQGSCELEVITDSHREEEIKQDQHINNKETYSLRPIKIRTLSIFVCPIKLSHFHL